MGNILRNDYDFKTFQIEAIGKFFSDLSGREVEIIDSKVGNLFPGIKVKFPSNDYLGTAHFYLSNMPSNCGMLVIHDLSSTTEITYEMMLDWAEKFAVETGFTNLIYTAVSHTKNVALEEAGFVVLSKFTNKRTDHLNTIWSKLLD